jgi:5-methylcytosine-specific restriction enzyme B
MALSSEAQQILAALKRDRCVLVSGPPATGKSRALNEVRDAFKNLGTPVSQPGAPVPIPAGQSVPSALIPSPTRTKRAVFQTELHQNSRYRQFWRDLEPDVGKPGAFRVSSGVLYDANTHALDPDGASLVIIEEGSRGPLVQVLGPSLTALESDKRLDDGGRPTPMTAEFRLVDDHGTEIAYQLSAHLYVLIARNNADTSVEGMDVALGRRFGRVDLRPDLQVLVDYFGINSGAPNTAPPAAPSTAEAVYVAAIRALAALNQRITVGRGDDFQLGHGVFIREGVAHPAPNGSVTEALNYLRDRWRRVEAHVDEVFHGRAEQLAAAFGVDQGHPYQLVEDEFGGLPIARLDRSVGIDGADLYAVMRAVGGTA